MNDLETRLRTGLDSEPTWHSPDDLLDDVRRGARRRRARRTTGAAAAAVIALALATAGGAIGWQQRQLHVGGSTTGTPLPFGTSAVSVTDTGEVFKVVSNRDCVSPCSTVWKRKGTHWLKMATFRSDQSPEQVVIRNIAMAPDGLNGWVWGHDLYATHDGGETWSRITTGPSAEPDAVTDVQVGQTQAWVTSSRITGGSALWHTLVGTDDWMQVPPPRVSGIWGKNVPARHWFVVDVLPDGRVALDLTHIYLGNEYGWRKEPRVPCRRTGTLLGGSLPRQSICGPVGRELNWGASSQGSSFQVGLHPLSAGDPVGQPDMLFVRRDGASIDTPAGVVPSDLRLGSDDEVVDWQQAGAHVVILTTGHRIFLSNDNGRHWTQVT
jgi:hypothetical protein